MNSTERLSLGTLACVAEFFALTLVACDRSSSPTGLFVEITEERKLPERRPYPDGCHFAPGSTPGGVALLDYDNDGDLDIYQVVHPPPSRPFERQLQTPAPNRLYEQQPDGTFREVAEGAGAADPGYGNGVAVGDVDNDGHLDLYVTNYGSNRLYVRSGATFRDVTSASRLDDDASTLWGASAAFVDYDRDGHLDLYVANYMDFNPDVVCRGEENKPDYCGPRRFRGLPDTLYHNNGDGTFTNVTARAGVGKPARGLGVVCVDLTGDDLVDIYVANDLHPNFLWVNQGDGTFLDESLLRGVAVNGAGDAESSMGVTVGDINNDGTLDLFMTHFVDQTNTLYLTVEPGAYSDSSATSGLSVVDLPYTGWGCGLFDFDHDGDLDLAVVNGRVSRAPNLPEDHAAELGEFWRRYAEPNFVFENDGSGQFRSLGAEAGSVASRIESTRGMALGDLDRDGDLDMVTTNIDNTLRLFRNDAPPKEHHWLRIRALTGARDALGAVIYLRVKGSDGVSRTLVRPLLAAQSYLSSFEPRVDVGLGPAREVESVGVLWPDGRRERFSLLPGTVDREITLEEGRGLAE